MLNERLLFKPAFCSPATRPNLFLPGEQALVVDIPREEYDVVYTLNRWDGGKRDSAGRYPQGVSGQREDGTNNATRTGALGEIAFAKICNEVVDLSNKHRSKDYKDYDFNLPYLGTVDVKTAICQDQYGERLLPDHCCIQAIGERGVEFTPSAQYYVCAYAETDDMVEHTARIVFVGYLPRDTVISLALTPSRNYHLRMTSPEFRNRELRYRDCRPIMELYEVIPRLVDLPPITATV